jgi:hypothetical protein
LIENSVLVVHGGIGTGLWSTPGSLRPDIDWLNSKASLRPITCTDPSSKPPQFAFRWTHLHNIVWSDPEADPGSSATPSEWRPHFLPNAQRGSGDIKMFNAALTKSFCERNHISMIIRSHEVKMGGYELQHNGLLCTVFSARNYAHAMQNDAGLVLLQPDDRGRVHCKFKTLKHLE